MNQVLIEIVFYTNIRGILQTCKTKTNIVIPYINNRTSSKYQRERTEQAKSYPLNKNCTTIKSIGRLLAVKLYNK